MQLVKNGTLAPISKIAPQLKIAGKSEDLDGRSSSASSVTEEETTEAVDGGSKGPPIRITIRSGSQVLAKVSSAGPGAVNSPVPTVSNRGKRGGRGGTATRGSRGGRGGMAGRGRAKKSSNLIILSDDDDDEPLKPVVVKKRLEQKTEAVKDIKETDNSDITPLQTEPLKKKDSDTTANSIPSTEGDDSNTTTTTKEKENTELSKKSSSHTKDSNKENKEVKDKESKDKSKSSHRDGKEKDRSTDKDKKSSKDRDRDRDKDKHRSKDDDRKRDRHHSSSSKSRKHHSSDKDKDRRDRDKHRDKERDRDRDRDRDRGSSSSSSSKSSSDKDQHKQADKDRATLEKVRPLSTDGLAKIPRKAPGQKSGAPQEPMSFLAALGAADPNAEKEKKNKYSLVKTKTSKNFRSTGLLDEPTPGPAGKKGSSGMSLPSQTAPNALKRAHSSDSTAAVGGDKRFKPSTVASAPDRPGGIKLISPKRRKWFRERIFVFQSQIFCDLTKYTFNFNNFWLCCRRNIYNDNKVVSFQSK